MQIVLYLKDLLNQRTCIDYIWHFTDNVIVVMFLKDNTMYAYQPLKNIVYLPYLLPKNYVFVPLKIMNLFAYSQYTAELFKD